MAYTVFFVVEQRLRSRLEIAQKDSVWPSGQAEGDSWGDGHGLPRHRIWSAAIRSHAPCDGAGDRAGLEGAAWSM